MRSSIIGICLLAGGCASNDCAMNAFELGQRDGMLGANQTERHLSRCGSSFDAGRYTEGFRDSFSRRPAPQGD
jgi:hypothetical protein